MAAPFKRWKGEKVKRWKDGCALLTACLVNLEQLENLVNLEQLENLEPLESLENLVNHEIPNRLELLKILVP